MDRYGRHAVPRPADVFTSVLSGLRFRPPLPNIGKSPVRVFAAVSVRRGLLNQLFGPPAHGN